MYTWILISKANQFISFPKAELEKIYRSWGECNFRFDCTRPSENVPKFITCLLLLQLRPKGQLCVKCERSKHENKGSHGIIDYFSQKIHINQLFKLLSF